MSKLSYALSMLALSGFAGAATQAAATVSLGATTTTLNLPGFDPTTLEVGQSSFNITPITLGGKSAPQFYFLTEAASQTNTDTGAPQYLAIDAVLTAQTVSEAVDFGTDPNGVTIANPYAGSAFSNAAIGIKTTTPGLPTHGETFTNTAGLVGLYKAPYVVDGIDRSGQVLPSPLYLHVIFDPAGQTYIGSFKNAPDGGLASITFNAVPEPDAWALLIAGAAMTGGALRSRRHKATATA